MGWEKVSSLVELAEKELEIQKKKEELRQRFKEAFGIEPKKLSTEKALAEFRDDELPKDLRAKIRDLLSDLDHEYDHFTLDMQVYRTFDDEEYDWKVTASSLISIEKRENKLCYLVEIFPLDYDEDC